MESPNTAHYRRRNSEEYVPATEAGQGVVARAELAALGIEAEPPTTMAQRATTLRLLGDEHEAERATAVLARYRERLEADFGAEITARIMSHRHLAVFVADASTYDLEPDEAVSAAAEYLREHPDQTTADAFTAVTALARQADAE
jgi:hypothetical protein